MELVKVNTKSHKVVVAPLGDLQWSGMRGPTARDHVRRHVERCLELGAWFVGMGDYTDFASPSNRAKLRAAGLYDTSEAAIEDKATELALEVYEDLLKPTTGRWLGLLEGHHFMEFGGTTTDMILAEKLETEFLGTSAYIRLEPAGVTIWCHHGLGGGVLPTSGLNKLYHVANGFAGADLYLMGHNTKAGIVRLSRPMPDWNKKDLVHSDIFLVNCGGFSKSNIVGHRRGRIIRGDYAEQKMLTPSPLTAPIIHIDGKARERIRVEV